MSHCA